MGNRARNYGVIRELDFSALEESESHRSSPPIDVTRTAPYVDEGPTRDLEQPPLGDFHRTLFSNKAALLAELLRDKFFRRSFGFSPPRFLRVDQPEGPSTAGGLLARQAISLVARRNSEPSALCGWVDTSKGEAQLRSYESVKKRYESHHGRPFDLDQEQYERFLDDIVTTLLAGAIKVRVIVPEDPLATAPAPRPRQERRTGRALLLMGVFLLGLFAGRWVPWSEVDSQLQRLSTRAGQWIRSWRGG